MKACSRCNVEKALDQFSDHPAQKDGKQTQCKPCCAERARLRRAGRPCATCAKPLAKDAPRGSKVCSACLSLCTACGSEPRADSGRLCVGCRSGFDKERKSGDEEKFKSRITRIASKYKVSRMLASCVAAQRICEACGRDCRRPGELHVDHCHDSGEVRGVLCFNCNAALGHVSDSVLRLEQLIAYVERTAITKHSSDAVKARHFLGMLIEQQSNSTGAQ